ncbi:MAG: putative glycosyltransferase [Candidatus Peregrinibacteria bacterium Gr01-1014_25]|nr:MAG: putative glycosyltransferase [Candidatus Peregrinibacteria bacterium Gr01-1014_25]
MRIAYCTNVRLPSERAHGHQVARVCDALAGMGHEVVILAPYRRNPITSDFWSFHGADRRVRLTHIGYVDPIDHPLLPKIAQLPILNGQLRMTLPHAVRAGRFDLLYTRSPALLGSLLTCGHPTILELHALPQWNRQRFVRQCNRCTLVVCLTSAMRDELAAWGVDARRIVVEPDAVDLAAFTQTPHAPSPELEKVAIESGTPVIGYAGQLESMGLSKGIPELLDALELLRRKGAKFHTLIAGPQPKNDALTARLTFAAHCTYLGFLPHDRIPALLAMCSILVYPAPKSDHSFYVRDTSPLKIFEYMAAGKPIVTADLPPIRDVLDESMASFCKPGDPDDLARAIGDVLRHPDEARARAEKARKAVERYTWGKRMARILAALPQ